MERKNDQLVKEKTHPLLFVAGTHYSPRERTRPNFGGDPVLSKKT